MQTAVIHLMPFFLFSRRKEGWWREKTERSGDLFFLFVCLFVSCSPSSLVLSRPPNLLIFFFPFFFSKILHPPPSLHTKKERTSSQFRVFCPHCIAITPSTIVLLVGRGGGGDCIDIKTSNAYGLHRNYYK